MTTFRLWKQHRIIPSRLLHIEDELIDAVLKEEEQIHIGEVLTIELSSKQFDVRVVRRRDGKVQLFCPQLHRYRDPDDRRVYSRHEMKLGASILAEMELQPVQITDMSNTGFGFTGLHELGYDASYPLILCTELLTIAPQIRITHRLECFEGIKYGAEIQSIRPEEQRRLRSYLMFYHLLTSGD